VKKQLFAVCLIILMLLVEMSATRTASAIASARLPMPIKPHRVCGTARAGYAHCNALVLRAVARPHKTASLRPYAPMNNGPYSPQDLHQAYNLPFYTASLQTIAIVDAFDDPNAETDLATYRSTFGLPPCTSANGCFRKVNQYGDTSPLPTADPLWAQEIALDIEMASAICTNCNILLVEANSPDLNDLGMGVNSAVRLQATVISNSYGSDSEFAGESTYCRTYFNHPSVAITVSAGDNGPGVQVPAVCPNVTAVGGTTLHSDGSETGWGYASGGCSLYIHKPTWQRFTNTNCPNRAVADVAAVADPLTGVYVYNSYGNFSGWFELGGTSAAAPVIAGVYALIGNARSVTYPAFLPWLVDNESTNCLNDVPDNSTEYTFQSGLGTPRGIVCF